MIRAGEAGRASVACAALFLAGPSAAEDAPLPQLMRNMEKGEWRVVLLEGVERDPIEMLPVTICAEKLYASDPQMRKANRPTGGCQYRLVTDAADKAVMTTTCAASVTTTTLTRQGKSTLMETSYTGPSGPKTEKWRYTYLGPCRAGQPAVANDELTAMCRKLKSMASSVPQQQCAQAADRQDCEKQAREIDEGFRKYCP